MRSCLALLLIVAVVHGAQPDPGGLPDPGDPIPTATPRPAPTAPGEAAQGAADPKPEARVARGDHWRFGPLLEQWRLPDGRRLYALHPLHARFHNPPARISGTDLLWPLLTVRTRDGRREVQGLLFVFRYLNADLEAPESPWQAWLLPVFMAGRSQAGAPYAGVFPLGGTWRNFFGYDRITFRLFPLYLHTRKAGAKGEHWLWPIFAEVEGTDFRKWRLFPLYGRKLQPGSWDARFVLWPFVHFGWSLNAARPGSAVMLLPLFGRIHREQAEGAMTHYTVLWPFFSYRRAPNAWRLHAPWPFLRLQRDEQQELTATHIWPFYGDRRAPGERSRYWLWPFIQHQRVVSGETEHERRYLLPFYYDFRKQHKGERSVYRQIWPLGTWQRDARGKRLRLLDLWPGRDLAPVQRNYAPFWTLYEYRETERRREDRLLWGAWHYRRQQSERHWSVLGGLIGHDQTAREGKRRRFLWLRF